MSEPVIRTFETKEQAREFSVMTRLPCTIETDASGVKSYVFRFLTDVDGRGRVRYKKLSASNVTQSEMPKGLAGPPSRDIEISRSQVGTIAATDDPQSQQSDAERRLSPDQIRIIRESYARRDRNTSVKESCEPNQRGENRKGKRLNDNEEALRLMGVGEWDRAAAIYRRLGEDAMAERCLHDKQRMSQVHKNGPFNDRAPESRSPMGPYR